MNLRERIEAVHLELVHHLDQAVRAGVVAGAQRIDVALQFHRQARAGADEIEERLVRPALIEAFDDRDVHPFLEHRAAFRSHAEAADVDHMRGVGEQADDLAVMKRRA